MAWKTFMYSPFITACTHGSVVAEYQSPPFRSGARMHHFEAVRSLIGSLHTLRQNDPYLISFDLSLPQGRHQGIYLAELEDEGGRRYLRISTPIGPLIPGD